MNGPWDMITAELRKLSSRIDGQPTFREATVAAVSPLEVLFDTDTSPTTVARTLAPRLNLGDRVLTFQLRHYLWVVGRKESLNAPVAPLMQFGSVANYAALPTTGIEAGDLRKATDTGVVFMWDGNSWEATQLGAVPYVRAVSADITQSNTSTGDINYTSANLRGGMARSGNAFVVPAGCGGTYSLNATARSFNQSLNVFIRLYVNGSMIANITSGGQEGIHISHVYEVAAGMTLSVRIFPYTGSTGIGDLLFSAARIGG